MSLPVCLLMLVLQVPTAVFAFNVAVEDSNQVIMLLEKSVLPTESTLCILSLMFLRQGKKIFFEAKKSKDEIRCMKDKRKIHT